MIRPLLNHRRIGILTGTSLCLWAACVPQDAADVAAPPDPQLLILTLLETDEAFNQATQELGAVGWTSFFDDSGVMIQEGVGEIGGLDAIYSTMDAMFSAPGALLTWEPRYAHASDDGTLGLTVGDYEATGVDLNGENVLSYGLHVSIWRRQFDGSWKVLLYLETPTD